MPEALEVFATYMQVWALAQLVELGTTTEGEVTTTIKGVLDWVQMALMVGALVRPKTRVLPGLALCARMASRLGRLPEASESDYVGFLTDLPTALCILARHPQKTTLLPSRAIRWQLGVLYLASGFWKLNSSFLHPRYSCATSSAMQLADAFKLNGWPVLARAMASAWPWMTIALEAGVGAAVLSDNPEAGIFAGLVLHAMMALTPPPNDLAGLGVALATRYFWLAPFAVTRACRLAVDYAEFAVHASVGAVFTAAAFRRVSPYGAVSQRAATSGVSLLSSEAGVDWAAGAFGVLASLVARAAVLHHQPDTRDSRTQKREGIVAIVAESSSPGVAYLAVALAALYGFAGVFFGLVDVGAPTVLSGLRVHGGSNHALGVPTGLFQRVFRDDPRSVFSGGVLRVEDSTSDFLNARHPAQVSDLLAPGARALLLAQRRPARIWNSGGSKTPNRGPAPRYAPSRFASKAEISTSKRLDKQTKLQAQDFHKFTLPTFELTRLLNLARRRLPASSRGDRPSRLFKTQYDGGPTAFRVVYARLDGSIGDEDWRRHNIKKLVRLDVDATGTNCTVLDDGSDFDDLNPDLPKVRENEACAPEDFLDGRAWATSSFTNLLGRAFLASHSLPVVPRLTLTRYERHSDELSCYGI